MPKYNAKDKFTAKPGDFEIVSMPKKKPADKKQADQKKQAKK